MLSGFMATISVPLSPQQQESLDSLVANGAGASRADVVRKALQKYAEDAAIEAILKAQKEPTLYGNLDELLAKID